MKMVVVGAMALAAVAGAANAATLLSTGFEAPAFTTGALSGQNGFQVSGTGWTVGNAAGAAATGTQYVENSTTSPTTGSFSRFAWVDTPLSQANLQSNGESVVRAQVNVRLSGGGSTTRTSTGGILLFADAGNTLIGGIRIQNNGAAAAVIIDNGVGGITGFTGLPVNAYISLAIEADFTNHTLKWFVGATELGALAPTFSNQFGATVNNFSDADLFTSRNNPAGSSGGHIFRFDDFSVASQVPTPGALALMGLGGLVAARRRRA